MGPRPQPFLSRGRSPGVKTRAGQWKESGPLGAVVGSCTRNLRDPPTTQMSKLRLQEQVALVAQPVCLSPQEESWLSPAQGAGSWELPLLLLLKVTVAPSTLYGGKTRHQLTGWPSKWGDWRRRGSLRPNCCVRQEVALCCFWQVQNTGFRLLGPELQLYRQPVILFKQPLLFEVAGLADAVTMSITIVTGWGEQGDRQVVTLTSGLIGTHPHPRAAPSVTGLRPAGPNTLK